MALTTAKDIVAPVHKETTYGPPATVVAADAVLLMGAEIAPAADKLEREVNRPYFGGNPFVLVGKRVTLTATIDLLGAATLGLAAPLGVLYKICAHAETLVATTSAIYNPISKAIDSATLDFYWAGVKFRMTGVRGLLDFDFSIKNFGKATINLTGLFTLPADGTIPVGIDLSAFRTPLAVEAGTWTVTAGGVTLCANQLTMSQNRNVALIECSSGREDVVTARKPGGTLRVLKDAALATWNPWSIADAQSVIALTNVLANGVAPTKKVSIPMNVQLEYPKPTDIDGVAGYEIPFTCVPVTGNDEYSIQFI